MAKMSMINREIKRQKLVKQFTSKRLELKKIVKNRDLPMEERFKAQIKLANLEAPLYALFALWGRNQKHRTTHQAKER